MHFRYLCSLLLFFIEEENGKEMNNQVKFYLISVLLIVFFCVNPLESYATDESLTVSSEATAETIEESDKVSSDVATRAGFTVEAIQPETQINKDVSFFYPKLEPEQDQILKVKVISTQKEKTTVNIYLTNAVTNSFGQVDYGQKQAVLDESLEQPLTDFTSVKQKKISVENFEEKIVEVLINPPKKTFPGIRLGAVCFEAEPDEKEEQSGVTNTYGYKIGLVLNEDLKPYDNGGEIKYINVEPTVRNGEKVVAMKVQNPNPYLLTEVTMETNLFKDDNQIASEKLEHMSIAPNSSFEFLTKLGYEDLKPGKYKIVAHATDGKQEWDWEMEFEIDDMTAKRVNKEADYKLVLPKLYIVLGSVLTLVSIGNVGYLCYRRKKLKGSD